MPRSDLYQNRWLRAALVLGLATLCGLLQVSQSTLYMVMEARAVPWGNTLVRGLSDWYLWALWTPLVFYLARTNPLVGPHFRRSLVMHSAASFMLAMLTLALMVPICLLTQPRGPRPYSVDEIARFLVTFHLLLYLWIYWSIVGVWHALSYYRKFQERELRASQLEARLAQARLQVLKMQLHPHFLFNTLNAIASLMHQDPDVADRMIARLGTLLRLSLENSGAQEVPLAQELDFVQAYLEIEQARLGERLHVDLDVALETLDAHVPNLLLQPLVENAIRHGIAVRPDGGCLTVRARRSDQRLYVDIQDDGPGLTDGVPLQEGIGLSNTRKRLKQLYGGDHRFELHNVRPHGLCASIVLPFRPRMENRPEINLFESNVLDGGLLEQALNARS